MKRRLFILLALALAALLAAASALAEGVQYDAVDDVLTVSCSKCVSGDDYALMLLKNGSNTGALKAGDVLFIDQLTADDSGRIEAVFIHPAFPACYAVAGGAFADGGASPRTLGSFAPEDAEMHPFNAPAMLSVIGEEAFEGSAFTHVYLGENVTAIGKRAFANCAQLRYIYIPEATEDIADDAFFGCGDFTIGCHENSEAHRYAIAKNYAYRLL